MYIKRSYEDLIEALFGCIVTENDIHGVSLVKYGRHEEGVSTNMIAWKFEFKLKDDCRLFFNKLCERVGNDPSYNLISMNMYEDRNTCIVYMSWRASNAEEFSSRAMMEHEMVRAEADRLGLDCNYDIRVDLKAIESFSLNGTLPDWRIIFDSINE